MTTSRPADAAEPAAPAQSATDPDDWTGSVVVVVPARNEAACVGAVLHSLPRTLGGRAVHTLVVDDHSTDATATVATGAGALVRRTATGQGQGAALRTGYAEALARGAAVVVAMDADGQHVAEDLPALVAPVLRGDADITVGSRVLGAADPTAFARRLGIPVFAAVMSVATGRRVSDPACGLHAASGAALTALDLRQDQFHNAEFLVAAAVAGLRVVEVPVTVRARTAGESRKPRTARYATGFLSTVVRTRLRGARGG